MAWDVDKVTRISAATNPIGVGYYDFAPTELVFRGQFQRDKNQTVQEAESGVVKVLNLSAEEVRWFAFEVRSMPFSDRTVGSLTIRGANSLQQLIRTIANYQETLLNLWVPEASKATFVTAAEVRFWGTSYDIPLFRKGESVNAYYGTGQTLLFRQEIS